MTIAAAFLPTTKGTLERVSFKERLALLRLELLAMLLITIYDWILRLCLTSLCENPRNYDVKFKYCHFFFKFFLKKKIPKIFLLLLISLTPKKFTGTGVTEKKIKKFFFVKNNRLYIEIMRDRPLHRPKIDDFLVEESV